MNFETHFAGERLAAHGPDGVPRRRRRLIVLLLIGAILLAIGLFWWAGSGPEGANPAVTANQIPVVSVAPAQETAVVLTITGTGSIAARRDMPVGVVGEGGRVTAVLVEPGSWVKAGQVLARIERSVQSAQVAGFAAQLETARADAKLAQANLDRARALVRNGFISRADLDSRVATRDAAVARVSAAAAQLRQAQASMARLDVRAPAEGLVLTRNVEPGQVVSGGSAVLFRIAKGGEMEMRMQVPEGDLHRIRVGASAEVKPIGVERAFAGSVWQVAPVVNQQTRLGEARILLRYDPALKPGAFAHGTVRGTERDGFVLPESAIQSDGAKSFVYVIGKGNKAMRREIAVGPLTDKGVIVLRGLGAGDQVVTTAGAFLNPGDVVRPAPAKPAG